MYKGEKTDEMVRSLQEWGNVYIRAFSRMNIIRALYVSQHQAKDLLGGMKEHLEAVVRSAKRAMRPDSEVQAMTDKLDKVKEKLLGVERVLSLMPTTFMAKCAKATRDAQGNFSACNRNMRRWKARLDRLPTAPPQQTQRKRR